MALSQVTKDKVDGDHLPRSSSNPLYMNGQYSSTDSLMSTRGGETSVVATVVIGGTIWTSWDTLL